MAAINKNFVIKNGLEVDTNLIIADAYTNKVGIGTTNPQYTLHVSGGIGATDAYVSGIGTFVDELNVGLGGTVFTVLGLGNSIGIGTALPAFLLDVRAPVSTGQTALYVQGDIRVTGDLNIDDISITNLNVTGFSTFVGFATFRNNIFVAGISTFVGFSTFNDYVFIQDGLNVTGAGATLASINVTGLTTIRNTIISGITTITNTTDSTTFNDGALVIDGGLGVEKSVNIGGNLDVDGNITIGGSFFSLQSQEVFISNKDIVLGFTTTVTPNDDTANHAGIAIASTEGSPLVSFTASGINTLPDTYKQIMWFRSGTLGFSTDIFGINYGLAIGTTTVSNGVRLAVGSNVTVTDTTVNAPSGNFTNLTGTAGTITTLNSTSGTITNLTGTAGTITTFNSTNGTITTFNSTSGTITNLTGTSGTITTFNSTTGNITNLTNTNLNVTGIATIATLNATGIAVTNFTVYNSLSVGGISTFTNGPVLIGSGTSTGTASQTLQVTGDTYVSGNLGIGSTNPTSALFVVGDARITGVVTATTFSGNVNAGVGTITTFNSTNGTITNLNVTGISTLGTVRISSGIITATSGIVTYYGDGSNLTGLAGNPTLQTVLNTGNTSTIGMSISGVITATSFFGDGSGLTGVGLGTTGSINTSGIITASSFFGNGSGLTGAGSTVFIDITTNQEFFPLFTATTSGTITASGISTSKLTYNPSSGAMTAVDFNSTSDINLKENIHTVGNALEITEQLRGVSFDWKETGRSSYGVIAQELQEILPDLVKDGEVKSVNYNGIIGVLIEAIKELKKEVEDFKSNK